jgi:GntR family transcriptional regulator, transcriptional repressor for pyruvate dehydrogenase complex
MNVVARPKKTALLLAQRIVRDIDRQGLVPGDKLPAERQMMEQYDAGRGTLRESLRYLELQGLLSFKPGPGGGPVVQKPGADSLAATLALLLQFDHAPYRVIAEARSAFEPVMASLAAERITPERLVELERSVVDMEEGIEDIESYLESNERFHDTIAWASGNSLFGFLIDVMVDSMDLSGASQGIQYSVRRRHAVLRAHTEILEAIRKGDAGLAESSMRIHIDEYVTHAMRKYPEAMERLITWQ